MVARYEIIAAWANEFGWTSGAELGIFDGRTHLHLLAACPKLRLIGVDVWDTPGFAEGPTKSGERCFCPYCSETRAARKTWTVAQMKAQFLSSVGIRSTIYIEPTVEAAKRIPMVSLDFVFIDASHATEDVSADIKAWHWKVRSGGRLIGHDRNMRSVMDAVRANIREDDLHFEDDHIWWTEC